MSTLARRALGSEPIGADARKPHFGWPEAENASIVVGHHGSLLMEDDQAAGFKKLSVENWRQADPTNENFVRRSELTGEAFAMEEDDWARQFLAVELKGHVPVEIRDLFAVARGAMIYGWFFYPLFYLGEEQLYRLTETALRRCYRHLGGAKCQPTFRQAVDFLTERRVIPFEDRERWEAARKLRNAASHPERASVMPRRAPCSAC